MGVFFIIKLIKLFGGLYSNMTILSHFTIAKRILNLGLRNVKYTLDDGRLVPFHTIGMICVDSSITGVIGLRAREFMTTVIHGLLIL